LLVLTEPEGNAHALFSNDAKLSKAYPAEADVWRLARARDWWSMWCRKTARSAAPGAGQ
jgi:hypothetical protein